MQKKCKDCKNYKKVNDIWSCNFSPLEDNSIRCYLIHILIRLDRLTSLLTEGAKHQQKIFPKVEKMLDKGIDEIDEGNEWKDK